MSVYKVIHFNVVFHWCILSIVDLYCIYTFKVINHFRVRVRVQYRCHQYIPINYWYMNIRRNKRDTDAKVIFYQFHIQQRFVFKYAMCETSLGYHSPIYIKHSTLLRKGESENVDAVTNLLNIVWITLIRIWLCTSRVLFVVWWNAVVSLFLTTYVYFLTMSTICVFTI